MDQPQIPNPLQKYFRAPGMHIPLPSKGAFNLPGEIDFTINGEVPVYPMTAADELILKSPDALFNGYSVEKVIQSCVPAIHNVRNLPSPDIDAVLLAIRSSSYGDKLEMEEICPKCNSEVKFYISIRTAIESAKKLDPEYPVRLSENVVLYVKPYTFECNTRASLVAFEQAKIFQNIEQNPDVPDEEKLKLINNGYSKLSELNLELNSRSVLSVIVPEGIVRTYEFIHEFLSNIDKNAYKMIDDKIKELNQTGLNKDHHSTCPKCQHEWDSELTFDPASFFAQGF